MHKTFFTISTASGFLALFLLALAGPSYRFGVLELGNAFTLMKFAAILGLIGVVLALVYGLWQQPRRRALGFLAASGIAGAVAICIPFGQYQAARSVPPIHDISTDLKNPPAFVAVAPLRQHAPNPVDYPGEETAAQQRQAYPGIQTHRLNHPFGQVYDSARRVVRSKGWAMVSTSRENGSARIEATDTTLWYGFKDDVVIRLQQAQDLVLVDVRSKSRIGKSDLGVNAERVQEFIDDLNEELASTH